MQETRCSLGTALEMMSFRKPGAAATVSPLYGVHGHKATNPRYYCCEQVPHPRPTD